jgi:dCMP deaminase
MSPCKDCSKLIHQAGIVRVVYQNSYKDLEGIELLKRAGVEVVQVEDLSSLLYE